MMEPGYFIIIGITLLVYFLLWRLYLLVVPAILTGFGLSDGTPNWIKTPKFWQFFLILFVVGQIRKTLKI